MEPLKSHLPRLRAAQDAEETLQIIAQGIYTAPSGQSVHVAGLVARAVQGTVAYPPDVSLASPAAGSHDTRIEVVNETTLAAARRLLTAGWHPAALNFASATHPGGGFRSGACAQEESLARASGLYACLRAQPMYGFHRARHDPLYTDYVIYSPEVPVWRADDGALLEEPYTVGIITSPAVNARALPPGRRAEIGPAMSSRIRKVLAAGVRHGHDSLVLGAWGCGAFGNDSGQIAGLFRQALAVDFRGAYRQVTFAVLDGSPGQHIIGAFRRACAG